MTTERDYQPELDGLRALAVAGVLLCHLDFGWIPGGFVGVDIFFVLSGFLITRLITTEISATGKLRFGNFYMRRLRRLYPALLTTVVVTWIGSFLLLSPTQMRDFASSAFAALFSLANVQFFLESGYFAALASTKPLLHTWSLSVEEQFYLVWPLLLFVLSRLLPRLGVPVAIALICAGSIWIGLGWMRSNSALAFYMLPSRAVELGLGALLVWLPSLRNRWLLNAATLAGIVAMIAPMLLYTERTPFPGWAALLPCAGAALFIIGARSEVAAPFRLRPVVWLGRISYSLYLVHWPVIVLWTTYFYVPLDGIDPWLLMAVSVGLAWAQYHFVEQRFRRPAVAPKRNWPIVTATLAASVVVAGVSGAAALGGGWDWRVPADRLTQAEGARDARNCRALNPDLDRSIVSCQNYRGKDKDLFVWGDSHGLHLAAGLAEAYPDFNIYVMHLSGCVPQSGFGGYLHDYPDDADEQPCVERNRKAFELFTKGDRPYNIIMTSAKRATPEVIAEVTAPMLDALQKAGNTVVFLGDFIRPGWNLVDCSAVPSYLVSDAWRAARCSGLPRVARVELDYNTQLSELAPAFTSINDIQCPDDDCVFFDDGRILFRDDDHLNDRGSVLLVNKLKPFLPFG